VECGTEAAAFFPLQTIRWDGTLAGEKLFQDGEDFRYLHEADLPNDFQIDVGIVMSHNVAHAAHSSEGKLGDRLTGGFGQVSGGFSNNFDAPNYGILLLTVPQKIGFRRNLLGKTQSGVLPAKCPGGVQVGQLP